MIQRTVQEAVRARRRGLPHAVSIGAALFPQDAATADDLLKAAAIALSLAKSEGSATYRRFEVGMTEAVEARQRFDRDLRHAFVNGEFELHYQPLVELDTQAILGCEALIRGNHPVRGMVPPIVIPIAESSRLIVDIGAWVPGRHGDEAFEIIQSDRGHALRCQLMDRIVQQRARFEQAGLQLVGNPSAIVPVIVGDEALAGRVSAWPTSSSARSGCATSKPRSCASRTRQTPDRIDRCARRLQSSALPARSSRRRQRQSRRPDAGRGIRVSYDRAPDRRLPMRRACFCGL